MKPERPEDKPTFAYSPDTAIEKAPMTDEQAVRQFYPKAEVVKSGNSYAIDVHETVMNARGLGFILGEWKPSEKEAWASAVSYKPRLEKPSDSPAMILPICSQCSQPVHLYQPSDDSERYRHSHDRSETCAQAARPAAPPEDKPTFAYELAMFLTRNGQQRGTYYEMQADIEKFMADKEKR